jgi:hypothetical protein
MKTYSAWTDQPGLERGKSKRATNKIMIVALAALILCFTWAKSGLAAQPQKPPASTAPVFTLLDSNGTQIGTVISFDQPNYQTDPANIQVVTRVPFRDSTGATRNVAFKVVKVVYPDQIGPIQPSGTLYFESTNCSGTPFIGASNTGNPGFLPAFDPYFLSPVTVNQGGILVIPTSTVLQIITAQSQFTVGCTQVNWENLRSFPGEFVGNIYDTYPPPYTLIAK